MALAYPWDDHEALSASGGVTTPCIEIEDRHVLESILLDTPWVAKVSLPGV